jgi:flagellar motor switch protein FliG
MPKNAPPGTSDEKKIDGKKEAVELLAALDEFSRERILDGIKKHDPALAAQLRKGMFTFEQVLRLDPPAFLRVIRELPPALLALASRGLDAVAEKALFSKLSERQGRALREERDSMGPQKLSDVTAARERITDLARTLHAAGEIDLLKTAEEP